MAALSRVNRCRARRLQSMTRPGIQATAGFAGLPRVDGAQLVVSASPMPLPRRRCPRPLLSCTEADQGQAEPPVEK
jgi:hypothetical protein